MSGVEHSRVAAGRPATRPGAELRGSRRLIAVCVFALALAGAGLILTVSNVASWIDGADREVERQRVTASLDRIIALRPDLPVSAVAMQLARDLSLEGGRLAFGEGDSGRELSVPLAGGAYLVWTAPRLGTAALRNFAPTRVPFILGAVACVALLLISVSRLAGALDLEKQRAQELASKDVLTGLGNRFAFEQEIGGRLRDGRRFALFCLDLDGFKAVNDSYGHAAGDTVLREVAARLSRLLGAKDAAFRLGGDEFALLLEWENRSLERFARKIALSIDEGYRVGPDAVARIGVSIGIAQAPADAARSDELMRLADAALYLAKAESGSEMRFATPPNATFRAADTRMATAA